MKALRQFLRIAPDTIERCRRDASYCEDVLAGDEEGLLEIFDVDQAWDAIHFLISANRAYPDQEEDAESLVFDRAIRGSKLHKGLDMGHGPLGVLSCSEVREIAEAFGALGEEELKDRFDPEAMDTAEVHPEIWKQEAAEAWEYVWYHYRRLVEFYEKAAKEGSGVITWVAPPLRAEDEAA